MAATGKRTWSTLLVEDEDLLCDLFTDFVETLPEIDFKGYAQDAEQARAMLAEHQPELVILDLRIPKGGGISVLQWIRQNLAGTRIIIFTGTIDEESLSQALKLQADAYIEKAQGLQELANGLRQVIASERYYSPGIARLVRSFAV